MLRSESMPLIISIGIDGGTWEIIRNYVQRGYLETIGSMIQGGCSGVLRSYPPITYPQWYVLLSGFNPGNIGVFSFVKYNQQSNTVDIVGPEDFRSPMIGDFLTKTGIRFAIINTPGIIPKSYKYDGYIVGDPFLPSPRYYPKSLSGVLSIIKYRNYDLRISKSMINSIQKEKILNIVKDLISKRFKLTKYLLKKDPKIRFIHLTIFVSDNIQHFFGLNSDVTLCVWSYIDSKINELINFVQKIYKNNYIINIISDHGFSDVYNIYNIGKDLENKGYIKSKINLILKILHVLGVNRSNIGKVLNKPLIKDITNALLRSNRVRKLAQKFVPDAVGDDPLSSIDINRSKIIYANYGLYISSKYINLKEKLKQELIEYFINLKTPENNKVFLLVQDKEKIFYGKYTKYAPDIILIPQSGIHVASKHNRDEIFWNPVQGDDWIADHTPEAIFISWGPRLTNSCKIAGRTVDYTPTILELLGVSTRFKDFNLDGSPIGAIINRYEI